MLNRAVLELIRYKKGLVGVEIGVERGGNALNILQNLDIKTLYLVDPFCFVYDSEGNLVEAEDGANAIEEEARRLLAPFSSKIVWVKGYSHKVLDQIPNDLDFVYIDGNHAYDYVKKDFENYYPKVRELGVIGGHDFNVEGVKKAVLEVANNLSYEGVESKQSLDCRAFDWWILKDEIWHSKIRNTNYKKHVTFHGNLLFLHKSHAHVASGFIKNMVELGNKVTQCVPYDIDFYDGRKKDHVQLRKLVSSNHVSTNYNIWFNPCGFEKINYNLRSKFNCFAYNDGHFLYPEEELFKLTNTPCNYILRSGKDAARTIANQTKLPVYHMYDYGVDTEMFNPKIEKGLTFPKDKFVFMLTSQNLWNFDLRGTDLALDAFLEEFKDDDSVILLLKIGDGYEILADHTKKHKNVTFLPGVISLETMASLYRSVDCMLAPIRGSMWEAPILQAMACGVPAIATDAGGPQTYIKNEETGILLNYEWKSEKKGDKKKVMFPGEIWKEPNVFQFMKAMRFAVENRNTMKRLGEAAVDAARVYTQRYLTTKLLEFFDGSEEFVVRPE